MCEKLEECLNGKANKNSVSAVDDDHLAGVLMKSLGRNIFSFQFFRESPIEQTRKRKTLPFDREEFSKVIQSRSHQLSFTRAVNWMNLDKIKIRL